MNTCRRYRTCAKRQNMAYIPLCKYGVDAMNDGLCCIKGCDKLIRAMGLCVNHWRMNKKYGSPVVERPLSATNRGLSDEERFLKSVRKENGCWVWLAAKDRDGYGFFRAMLFGVRIQRAHRFAYSFYTGEVLSSEVLVLHSCDNPSCCNPDHLSAGTPAQNTADMKSRGRGGWGKIAVAKRLLSDDQVREIRADPRNYHEIAAEYGVHKGYVWDIKNGRARGGAGGSAVRAERGARGIKRSRNLTEDDVRYVRASNERGVDLAVRFGIAVQTVCDIRKRRSWKHIA